MKILFISRGYPSNKYPMHGIFEFDQAKAISNLGHEVVFASVDMRSIRRKRKWGFEKLKKDNISIYCINIPVGNIPKKALDYFSKMATVILYKRIKKIEGKFDIIHAHFTNIGYYSSKIKDLDDTSFVVTEHSSSMMMNLVSDRLRKVAGLTYPKADRVIAVSPALRTVIKKEFNIDSVYIPNMVDTDTFMYHNREKSDTFTFITVGNLIYRKRMDLTVEAFSKAFRENENVSLIIIGEGEEREKIEKIIRREELGNRVKLKGRLDRKEICKYLKESDCFVLPSRAETFGVVYIEAMAVGLPVIATKCGGPEAFINQDNGLLINTDSLDELVNAMKYMYNNISSFDQFNIASSTFDDFSPVNVGNRIVDEYRIALNRRKYD